MHADRRQLLDLTLREGQGDGVVLDLRHCADRDRDLALSPEVPSLEHEVGDMTAVDHEPVHLPEEILVGRGDRACAPDLDLSFRDAVVADAYLAEVAAVPHHRVAVVVRKREDVFDAYVPTGIACRRLAESKIGKFLNVFEAA